ncbi:alpha/beta hydrolase [uncultured Actinomyces sp.]|uniref:alpha/beta hydrolase n=1 Tax=uncultured Actinomyces sp. TaxID=249061 RepID=UPI0028D0B394|nr:alpha/beta hydrolase [uncultured Actinomyces sp.]
MGGTTGPTGPRRFASRVPRPSWWSAPPATPYQWARSLAEQLDSGRLLTREGNGHTAYGRSVACTETVDSYLLTGELPEPEQVCQDQK